jgi:hypothetical protein
MWNTPLRKTRWYDFYIDLYTSIGASVEYIGAYKMNADISFDFNYKDMPYIGKAQFKKYVYNGGTMKWSVKAIYDADLKRPTVTRQDGMYPLVSENYPYMPQHIDYTNPAASSLPPIRPAKAYSTSIIMQARANYETVGSEFAYKFDSLFNNILWQNGSIFNMIGYEVPTLQNMSGNNQYSFGFINQVDVNMKFPLSDFTISGEKVFS